MANPEVTLDVNMRLQIGEKTLDRCLQIVDMWLEDNPDKTIVVEDEGGVRVCLIAERGNTDGAE